MGRPLGQHFLFDPSILDRIVDALGPRPEDVVVEIGAGRGTLTDRLRDRVDRVVTIERDRPLAEALKARAWPGLHVVAGDALDLDWAALAGPPGTALKLVGNVPYAISTPLIEHALSTPGVATIVYLLQREVADRLAAGAGSKAYGALSVGVQAAARTERLFRVRAGAFHPPPAVDSAVVRLTPLAPPLVPPAERAEFRRFTVALFGQRRRQLHRALRTVLGLDPAEAGSVVEAAGLDAVVRVETLSPERLVHLYRCIQR